MPVRRNSYTTGDAPALSYRCPPSASRIPARYACGADFGERAAHVTLTSQFNTTQTKNNELSEWRPQLQQRARASLNTPMTAKPAEPGILLWYDHQSAARAF